MEFISGISECWWLSRTCRIDWNAWAAIGTVTAVFAAIFAPEIQRRFVRKNANFIFAAAYVSDIGSAVAVLDTLLQEFPVGLGTDESHFAEGTLAASADRRDEFRKNADRMRVLAQREVDPSKWPAVDLELACDVTLAIDLARQIRDHGVAVANPNNKPADWPEFFKVHARIAAGTRIALLRAHETCRGAMRAIETRKGLSISLEDLKGK